MGFEIPDYLHGRVNEAISIFDNAVFEIQEAFLKKINEASLPDAQERRRYALLQAAATIMAADMGNHFGTWASGFDHANYVGQAECLLEEIEKREKAEGQS